MYLILRESPDAEPVVATAHPDVIRAVCEAIARHLGLEVGPRSRVVPLRPLRSDGNGASGDAGGSA